MNVKAVVIGVLLGAGILIQLVSCLGVMVMPNLMDRLHFLAPATSFGPAFIAAAIVVEEVLDHQGILAVMVAGFLVTFGPVLSHATARAARIRQHGDWRIQPGEKVHRS